MKLTNMFLCRENTFHQPHPQTKSSTSTSSMGGGRDDDTALLYSLMADEQDNQIKQIKQITQIKRYYSYSAKKMRNSSLIQKHSTKQKKKRQGNACN